MKLKLMALAILSVVSAVHADDFNTNSVRITRLKSMVYSLQEQVDHLNSLHNSNNDTYLLPQMEGTVTFNYSNNNGIYQIGEDPYHFETKWSSAGSDSIYVYNDPASIEGLALVVGINNYSEIGDGYSVNMCSRVGAPREGEFVILKNINGYYAGLKIIDVKDRTREDEVDELTFEYIILPENRSDFSMLTTN